MRNLLKELEYVQVDVTEVTQDNTGAIDWACGGGQFRKTKHIDICLHHVKDLVENNIIKIISVPTNEMVAELMTKPLCGPKLKPKKSNSGSVTSLREGECHRDETSTWKPTIRHQRRNTSNEFKRQSSDAVTKQSRRGGIGKYILYGRNDFDQDRSILKPQPEKLSTTCKRAFSNFHELYMTFKNTKIPIDFILVCTVG